MTQAKCERFGKWIGGCKFEPRYDLVPMNMERAWGYDVARMIEASKSRVYVADVCVRCGKQVKRP